MVYLREHLCFSGTGGFPDSYAARWTGYTPGVDQRKMFWVLVAAMGIIADLALPMVWSLLATLPILVASWWIVYRSDWF